MSDQKHTPEPWVREGVLIWAPEAKAVVASASELRTTGYVEFRKPELGSADLEEIGANAARIVDCVNALRGAPDPVFLRATLEAAAEAWTSGQIDEHIVLWSVLKAAGVLGEEGR